jgi:hypothetical protein
MFPLQILSDSLTSDAIILEILEAIKDTARKWIDSVPLGLFGEPSLSLFVNEVPHSHFSVFKQLFHFLFLHVF